MAKYRIDGLGPVAQSLLAPLWARASETLERRPILTDWNAVATTGAIDFPFDKLHLPALTHTGACVRTLIVDEMVRRNLQHDPKLLLINLGEGLDNRFSRVDNGALTCIDLDLPEVIELRRRFSPESARRRLIASNIANPEWIRQAAALRSGSVTLVAEGVLMYMPESEVRALFVRLAEWLPGCEIIFDTVSPTLAAFGSRAELGRCLQARFHWGVRHAAEIETWGAGYRLLERQSVFRSHPHRFHRLTRLLTRFVPRSAWAHSVNRFRLGR